MNQADVSDKLLLVRGWGAIFPPVLVLLVVIPLTVYAGFGGQFSLAAIREASATLLLIAFQFLAVLGAVWLLLTAVVSNGNGSEPALMERHHEQDWAASWVRISTGMLTLECLAMQWVFVGCVALIPVNLVVML